MLFSKLPIVESYTLKENVNRYDNTKLYIEMIEQFVNDPDTPQDALELDNGLADRIYDYGEEVMRIWSWRIEYRTNDCSIESAI
jgi:hypothetical protein